jgi:phosphatidylinositol alpha-1,6-mannosyltransferase
VVVKHLLVTNDFPPKIGGIQNLLYEWWRRLPSESFAVLTSPYSGSKQFDAVQSFEIRRTREPVLLPHPLMIRKINKMAKQIGAELVVLDPALPLGLIGPHLNLPYAVVLHGAEIVVPGRLPVVSRLLSRVLNNAELIVASGSYPAAEASRICRSSKRIEVITPGVDIQRFKVLSSEQRAEARKQFGVAEDAQLIVGISRLVPRKGFDVLIRAVARLAIEFPKLRLIIGGDGRDRARLERIARELMSPTTFLGRVLDDDLPKLYGCADVNAMLCRSRWMGLEQEGFGIVFAEAAACGVPQIAGRSGGASDAVDHDISGLIVEDPTRVDDVVSSLRRLLVDKSQLLKMGQASRLRAENLFDYDKLALKLGQVLSIK